MREYTTQMTARTGRKCDKALVDLFKDDVFVDFFNTFLNLPVFGQTPLYFLSENKWYMCPEIPQSQDVRRGSFFQWLRAHRFVYFKQTELYHYYSLCKEILWFSSCQAKEVLKLTFADQWLLKRCLGSVRGMRRFCSFVKGTRGEELVTFCVRVERLLQIDWQDVTQRIRYQALFTVIKAVHLTDGSHIMATCRIPPEGLLKIFSGSEPGEMKEEILAQMRSKALSRLQSYWLPQYLCASKLSITKLKECASIVKEYEDVASRLTLVENPLPPDPVGWSLGSELSEGQTVIRTYCSKLRKRVLWRANQRPGTGRRVGAAARPDGPGLWQWLPMAGDGVQGKCTNIVHYMSRRGEEIIVVGDNNKRGGSGKREGRSKRSARSKRGGAAPLRKVSSTALLEHSSPSPSNALPLLPILASKSLPNLPGSDIIPPHACMETPICHLPSIITPIPIPTTTPLPPTPPPSTPAWGHKGFDDHLSLALSADTLAGGPYEGFLIARGQRSMLHHLGLWQELDGLLNLLLKVEDGPSKALRQVLARKIVDVYLSDAIGGEGERYSTSLSKSTFMHLVSLLPSGNVMPWIYTAKQELCQILAHSYNAFLDEEDKHLLFYLFSQTEVKGKVSRGATAPSGGPSAPAQQVRRMREALALCQACCGYSDPEPLTEETWALLPLEDMRSGGSVHLRYRKTNLYDLPFETLAQRYPKAAVEEISKTHRLYCDWKPVQEEVIVPSPPPPKKSQFTLMRKYYSFAKRPSFRPRSLGEVLRSPANLDFFKHYLRANDAHKALIFYLEVEKLRNMDRLSLQRTKINSIVTRFLRRADAEEYLQCSANLISQIPKMRYVSSDILFAAQDLVIKSLENTWFKKFQDTFPPCPNVVTDTNTRAVVLRNKLKHVWSVFSRFIKSICKFRNAMKDISTRSKFEAYLRHNWHDFSIKYISTFGNRQIESVGLCEESEEPSHLKRRVINNKLITVDFLVSDLSFYLETESFRNMADSGTMMASAGMYGENDHALLHQKADMIMKLFLKSEISPTLRINIAESARESIQHSFTMGQVDRGLFHEAIMAVFPNLIFCWRKFCSQKVKRGMVVGAKKEVTTALPDYLDPFSSKSNWYRKVQTTISGTDYTTLRFTVQRGLNLVLPKTRLDLKLSSSALSPQKGQKQSSISTSGSSEFLPLEELKQRRTSAGASLSPQTSLHRSDITHSPSLSKIKEEE